MTSSTVSNRKKVRAVKQQCDTYKNTIRIRLQLQKYAASLARWPHPRLFRSIKGIQVPKDEEVDEYLHEIQDNIGRLYLNLYAKLAPINELQLDGDDPFEGLDILPQRRDSILQRLDRWNHKTNVKVETTFEVLNKSISSQIRYFLENKEEFLKKARPTNLPENIIGYDILKRKLGIQQCRTAHVVELYNDQLFYVQLLRYLAQNGGESEANLRDEEQLLRNDQTDKPRMSLSKTSKSRRIKYTVIDKLQNFVERTRRKAQTSPELVDLVIRSLFKT
ncbi:hypothetical protein BgAZ_403920 [Babesia gibsoni]|uniref:Apoptosis-antagonizing transcription factor C-terminal domain-containing protein n=1 Tax=Babesia gibsoni TaxID=33632 RepID=A0AAD8LQ77_BABGI|nr:hypothetical protein BgAZ_403920 [Babesia gibsoni]